jgi:hypothetical protein
VNQSELRRLLLEYDADVVTVATDVQVILRQDKRRIRLLPLTGMTQTTVVAAMMICTIGALSVAAVCTLLLVFAVRRAVLRQMNAALVDISAQLKQLNKAHGTSGGV